METPAYQPEEQASTLPAEDSSWNFHNEDNIATSTSEDSARIEPISWTASEYVAHPKTVLWFTGMGLAVGLLTIAVFLLTKDAVSTVVTAIIGITFGAFAARKPQVLDYKLDETGLHIGPKSYSYDRFKSFSIMEEEAIRSILLMPLQRFMPPLTVYYDPADEDEIVRVIGNYLPHEQRSHDAIDRLMRKIHF